MPRTKTPRGSSSSRGQENYDAFNFVSKVAQDNYLLGRPVQPCRNIHHLNFDCHEVLDRLTLLGWDLFVQNSRPFYPDLIRAFYANASFNAEFSTITSRYRGRDFAITPILLNTVLNIPNDGVVYYQTNSWAFPSFTEPQLRARFLCEQSSSREDCSHLSFPHRLAHFLLTKVVLPRDGHHTAVQKMDLFLLHHLFEGIRVNLGFIIIRHMAAAITHTSRSLPYGSLLTALLEYMEFDLQDVRPIKHPSAISTSTFSTLGFKKNRHGVWVRKSVVDQPSDDDNDDDPPPRASPPPFEPPPVAPSSYAPPPTDVSHRLDRIEERLDTMQTDVSGIKSYMDSLFGPSSAFYAAYGPHGDRPSSSTMPPPGPTTGDDDDDDEEIDDDD